ncbi:Uncharacterized protein HZ326_12796 [Fusarium oxysporum f. sp. albedinis]|nr:Uncharacterized protein HZ326_12796 [Fusarium oxysporum f. sp. albedinis]
MLPFEISTIQSNLKQPRSGLILSRRMLIVPDDSKESPIVTAQYQVRMLMPRCLSPLQNIFRAGTDSW